MIRQANQGAMMDTEQRARELRILADQCRGREDAAYRFEKGAAKFLTAFEREMRLDEQQTHGGHKEGCFSLLKPGICRCGYLARLAALSAKSTNRETPVGYQRIWDTLRCVHCQAEAFSVEEIKHKADCYSLSAEKGNTDGR